MWFSFQSDIFRKIWLLHREILVVKEHQYSCNYIFYLIFGFYECYWYYYLLSNYALKDFILYKIPQANFFFWSESIGRRVYLHDKTTSYSRKIFSGSIIGGLTWRPLQPKVEKRPHKRLGLDLHGLSIKAFNTVQNK